MSPPPEHSPGELARRLFEYEVASAHPGEGTAAAERLIERVYAGLSRTFGAFGAQALLGRAISRASADHPVLAHVTVQGEPTSPVRGITEAAEAHGTEATSDGVIALLTALIQGLGRLIGDDLAVILLEQTIVVPAPRPTPHAPRPTDKNVSQPVIDS
ncbi:MAG: hypothetical protein ABIW79_03740 [Gemmatimonas sp.]